MLPDIYDRYSLFSIFLKHYRLVRELTQDELIARMHENKEPSVFTQPTYSRFEKIGSFKNRTKPLDKQYRSKILSVLHTLKVPFKESCLLLWLLDGTRYQPLSRKEKEYYFPDTAEIDFEQKIKDDLWYAHQEMIKLLQKCLKHNLDPYKRLVNVKMSHGLADENFVENERRLFNLEKGKGHRLFMGKYPSILLSRNPEQLTEIHIRNQSVHIRLKYKKLLQQRIQQFEKNVKIYGARCIHSLSSIRRFALQNSVDELNRSERLSRIEHMINLLETEPNFHVALAESEPEWEIMIKSFECVALRPTSRRVVPERFPLIYGPTLIYWQNESLKIDRGDKENVSDKVSQSIDDQETVHLWNVIASYIDFESTWIPLHNAGRTERGFVISELKKLLHN